jgi:hypothetical protein
MRVACRTTFPDIGPFCGFLDNSKSFSVRICIFGRLRTHHAFRLRRLWSRKHAHLQRQFWYSTFWKELIEKRREAWRAFKADPAASVLETGSAMTYVRRHINHCRQRASSSIFGESSFWRLSKHRFSAAQERHNIVFVPHRYTRPMFCYSVSRSSPRVRETNSLAKESSFLEHRKGVPGRGRS